MQDTNTFFNVSEYPSLRPQMQTDGFHWEWVSLVFVKGLDEWRGFPGICQWFLLIKCCFLRGGERERSVWHQTRWIWLICLCSLVDWGVQRWLSPDLNDISKLYFKKFKKFSKRVGVCGRHTNGNIFNRFYMLLSIYNINYIQIQYHGMNGIVIRKLEIVLGPVQAVFKGEMPNQDIAVFAELPPPQWGWICEM